MLKVVLFVSYWFIVLTVQAQNVPVAEKVLQEALQNAQKDKKKVLVIFEASWCGWCKKMQKALNDECCKDFFQKNFVIVSLVVNEFGEKKSLENAGGEAYLEKWGGKNQGIPYWVILDKKGNLLENSKMGNGENIGCPAQPEEVEAFIEKLKKNIKMSKKEIAKIRERFLANR
ncbi:MAG: thioredoxin family protein [Raineya sp.]|nr:thioredoxin family protein [Raineya sp.]